MLFNSPIVILLAFLAAFAIVFTAIPTIVFIADAKKLYDVPGVRKAHKKSVPILGGVAIFSAVIISCGIFSKSSVYPEFHYVAIASIVLFFVGLKDDILIIAPMKKLIGQIFASLIIVVLADLRFTGLHGFLGIHHLIYPYSFILTMFVLIVIINGVNLIDGIDGLASGIGILASLIFGAFFYINGNYGYAVLSAAVIGSLIAFFGFNVFSVKNKIFMGDTGSLLVGLFLAIMAIRFNEMNINPISLKFFVHSAPAVSFGILVIPLFDTLRVFTIRILSGKSPFSADSNHVHHKLLALGFTHLKATLIIVSINAFIGAIVIYFNVVGIVRLMFFIFLLATLFSILPELLYKRKNRDIVVVMGWFRHRFKLHKTPVESKTKRTHNITKQVSITHEHIVNN